MNNLQGLCHKCVRYNPKAKANCILARDVQRLSDRHKYTLMVTECKFHAPPEKVFPEVNAQPTKTGNKKIDEDEGML